MNSGGFFAEVCGQRPNCSPALQRILPLLAAPSIACRETPRWSPPPCEALEASLPWDRIWSAASLTPLLPAQIYRACGAVLTSPNDYPSPVRAIFVVVLNFAEYEPKCPRGGLCRVRVFTLSEAEGHPCQKPDRAFLPLGGFLAEPFAFARTYLQRKSSRSR
jgi:hypothetical protein